MMYFDLQYFSQGAEGAQAAQGTAEAAENADNAADEQESQPVTDVLQQESNAQPDEEQPDPVFGGDERIDRLREQIRMRGRERMRDWLAQEEKMQEFYPSFSFHAEYNTNETFANLLRAGADVRQAYEVAHLPQILTTAMQYAAAKAAEKTAAGFRTGANRPLENGLSEKRTQLPAEKRVDALTQADIIRILERVGKGDKVTF